MLVRSANRNLLMLALDLLATLAAILIATWVRLYLPIGIPLPDIPWLWALLLEALLVYPLVFLALGVYTSEAARSDAEEFQQVVLACLVSALTLAGLMYFSVRETSRVYLAEFYLLHFVLVSAWRGWWRWQHSRRPGMRRPLRVLLVGSGEAAQRLVSKVHTLAGGEVELVGYLAYQVNGLTEAAPYLGSPDEAPRLVDELKIDDLLIALAPSEYSQMQELVEKLFDRPCSIWFVPDYFNLLIYGTHVRSLGGLPLISLKSPTLTPNQRLVKRAFDILVSGLALLLSAPVLGLIALAVRLDSPGPALLRQDRAGENGRLFKMFKFRSMVIDAEKRSAEAVRYDEKGRLLHKNPDDPRITRVGHILRRTSLDEVPQLINVLRGEMSLVGPRPELPGLVEAYEPWQRKRFAVPQGMTGWWQVNGRSDLPMHLNTEYDLYYIQNYSLLLDLLIILRTPLVVFRGKGAF